MASDAMVAMVAIGDCDAMTGDDDAASDADAMVSDAMCADGCPLGTWRCAAARHAGRLNSISLDVILSERAKEFYWEGYRRTDLIRFGKFTDGSYLWPFKGGIKSGRGVEATRALFPLPSADLIANPNLTQNPGY